MKRPVAVKDVLSGGLELPGLKGMLMEARIKRLWQDVVGKTLAGKCTPWMFKDGILHVRVNSPVWLTELRFHAGLIIKRLNEMLGEDAVERVIFRAGVLKSKDERKPACTGRRKLTERESLFIEEKIAPIKDPVVRDTVRRALEKAILSGALKK